MALHRHDADVDSPVAAKDEAPSIDGDLELLLVRHQVEEIDHRLEDLFELDPFVFRHVQVERKTKHPRIAATRSSDAVGFGERGQN